VVILQLVGINHKDINNLMILFFFLLLIKLNYLLLKILIRQYIVIQVMDQDLDIMVLALTLISLFMIIGIYQIKIILI
jgi:hypothetical protein